VRRGSLGRREFARGLLALGLAPPLIAELLRSRGIAQAQAKRATFSPTKRGGGGDLKLLWWQAPTILNPHMAVGVKDGDGSRLFYEPLVSFDPDGNFVPVLAAEVPTVQNGMVARDGLSVTVRLKKGVHWHDGKPFTADDVVFTWEYAADPATLAVSAGSFESIARVDKLDTHTVKIVYKTPTPFWASAFRGVIARHVFERFKGGKSREAPANLKPVGTGPYRIVEFKPGDVVRAEIFPAYHESNWPFFDRLEMKGGGDAVSAARAVCRRANTISPGTCRPTTSCCSGWSGAARARSRSPGAAASSTSSATSPIRGVRSTASDRASKRRIRSSPIRVSVRR
jgi:peptide/nickel transport system substrate-binding protein